MAPRAKAAPVSRDRLRAALNEVGLVVTGGASYEVTIVVVDDTEFELSMADPEMDVVDRFGRRDFTVNALGWSAATGELIDPWAGAVDLGNGVLHHTTPESLTVDPLRILRGIRFAGTHGFQFDPDTGEIARSLRDAWESLSADRIWAEWRTLARRATNWPAALEATGWTTLFPELEADPSCIQVVRCGLRTIAPGHDPSGTVLA